MKKLFLIVSLILSACGPQDEFSNDEESVSYHAEMCPIDDYSCNPEEPGDSIPILFTKPLYLELWNSTSAPEGRICYLSYKYTKSNGTLVSGAIAAAELLAPGQRKSQTIQVPLNLTVQVSGGCWHPAYPEVNLRATTSLTTLPMDRSRGCMLAYSEPNGVAQAQLPCWY